jgi:uncharacterized protein (TIGR02145 family)
MKNTFFSSADSGLAFIDPHDRTRYSVFFLNGRLWFASNLKRFTAFQSVSHDNNVVDQHVGFLYKCDDELENIIPDGFRLPSVDEFKDFFSKWKDLIAVHPLDVASVLKCYGDIPLAGTAFLANPCGVPEFKDFDEKGFYITKSRDEQGYRLAVCITRDGCKTTRVQAGQHCSVRLTFNNEVFN